MTTWNDAGPDVEVTFYFNDYRKTPMLSGKYRPIHQIKEDYLTSGIHRYYSRDFAYPNDTVRGTITFLTPEFYPNCIWVGKKIRIQEGKHIVGYAIVEKIYNPILAGNPISSWRSI